MTVSLLKPIIETSYLNAQNVGRYRCIMRYFYEQHQQVGGISVNSHLKTHRELEEYFDHSSFQKLFGAISQK